MSRKEISRLPLTRKEQIIYTIRYEAASLFGIGLLAFIFLLPLLATFFALMLITKSMIVNEASANELFNLYLLFGAIHIPCVFLFGVGNMGLFNCIRELIFESSTHFVSFFKGVKRNFGSYYKYYLLLSILIGLFVINIGNLMFLKDSYTLKLIIFVINSILLLATLIVKPYVMFEASVFDNGLLAYLRNGFYFLAKNFGKAMLNFVLFILPYVLVVVLPINFIYIPVGLLAVGYISLYSLINYIISLDVFEKSVSPEEIKSIYHVGLQERD